MVKRSLLFCFIFGVFGFSAVASAPPGQDHFNINIDKSLDKYDLVGRLNSGYFVYLENIPMDSPANPENTIHGILNGVYRKVSDILDIHLDDVKINLWIVPDQQAIGELLRENYGQYVEAPSFYWHERSAIYVSAKDLTLGILAHEIAHVIVSHYFVVPPPGKVQDVLCGYAEYLVGGDDRR